MQLSTYEKVLTKVQNPKVYKKGVVHNKHVKTKC